MLLNLQQKLILFISKNFFSTPELKQELPNENENNKNHDYEELWNDIINIKDDFAYLGINFYVLGKVTKIKVDGKLVSKIFRKTGENIVDKGKESATNILTDKAKMFLNNLINNDTSGFFLNFFCILFLNN